MKLRTKAELLLLLSTVIWGGTFVAVKGGLNDTSPMLFIALRFCIATVLFTFFAFSSIRQIKKDALMKGALIGLFLFIGFTTQTIGLKYTTASKSGFITGLLVIFTPIFQLFIERKPPKIGNIIGVILVTAGLFLLTSPQGSGFNVGDFLTLICAAMFGLYIVYVDIFTKQHDGSQIAFMQFIVTAVLSVLGAVLFEHTFLNATQNFLFALAYLTFLATLFTLTIQTTYQKETSPTRAAVIFSIEPLFSALFAYLMLGEIIGTLGMIWGGLIVGGVLVSELLGV
ncbi:MAG: DMT family transporter [Ignavibacteriales bacterium]|nr:DMT family transporter [Ignavibacteriales bacterium]